MPADKKKTCTGPKTPEGKDRSKRNAQSHELLSSYACLSVESKAECDRIELEYIHEYRPATPTMRRLVQDLALYQWRINRCICFETGILDREIASTSPDPAIDAPLRAHNDRASRAFSHLAGEEALALLSRYETRFHRMWHRTLKAIHDVQDRAARPAAPGGRDIAVHQPHPAAGSTVHAPDGEPAASASPATSPNELPSAAAGTCQSVRGLDESAQKANLPNELPPPSSDRMWLIDKRTGICYPLDPAA